MLVAVAVIPALVLPGDVPFINDDALLLGAALDANEAGSVATAGLEGTKGLRYGPVPTWIYQVLLLATHDPFALAFAHALLLGLALAGALFGLERVTGLWTPFGLVLAASPYLWFYERLLWDNTFNLAFLANALLLYLVYESRRSRLALAGSFTLIGLSLLTHAMALPMAGAIAGHFVLKNRKDLLRVGWIPVVSIAMPVLACIPYLGLVWDGRTAIGEQTAGLWVDGLLFAFTGPRLLGAYGLDYFFGERVRTGVPLAMAWLSLTLYPISWIGMAIAARRVWRTARGDEGSALVDAGTVALAAVVLQAVLGLLSGAVGHPHYHNGTWVAHAVLAWIGVDALVRWRPTFRWAGAAWVVGMTLGLLATSGWLVRSLHATAGTRGIGYGTTMGEQVNLIRELRRYSPELAIRNEVPQFDLFPHTVMVLGRLLPRTGPPDARARVLLVRYSSHDPEDAHVEVVAR